MTKNLLEERGLPCNIDAERLILGSILMDSNGFMPTVMDVLEESDFMLDKHRRIFRHSAEIYRSGEELDRITLASRLYGAKELEAVDGLTYLSSLDDGLPRLPNIDAYIRIVREKSILRRCVTAYSAAIEECLSGTDKPDTLLARAESSLRAISAKANSDAEFQTPEQIIMASGSLDGYLRGRRVSGIPTHIPTINHLTRGLQPASMNILAAKTSRGKTAFALNIAHHVACAGTHVAIFSHEMEKPELTDRLICIAGGITFDDLYHGTGPNVVTAVNRAASLPIHIRDLSASVPAIHAKTRKLMGQFPIGLVIVDYLQLVESSGRHGNRTEEVSAISRGLKLIAQDLKLPFLVLSQFKRTEGTSEPQLNDLRESGSIENDANTVIFLHSDRDFRDLDVHVPASVKVILAKQRNGPLGTAETLFERRTGRFVEVGSE